MANYEDENDKMDLMDAFLALQHYVSSINYACGVFLVFLHAALERNIVRLDVDRSPHPFRTQLDHLNRLVRYNDVDCHDQLRMNRHTFIRLCTLLRGVGLCDSRYVVLEEKVAMFLWTLAHHKKNRTIKFAFMRSGQTVSKYFNDVLHSVLRLQGVLLKVPEPIANNCTDERWRWFQNCLGALDGTYVKVLVPSIDKPRYRTRKGEIATNVLGMSKRAAKSSSRRFWTQREEEFLMGCMTDLLNQDSKWKLDCGQFKGGFYGECEKKIICAFPGTDLRANPHIESKIKMWRRQYNLLQDMLKTSGFGWDDVDKMILVDSDDVWDNYVRREKDVKGMRNKTFPYYEAWLVLFGKDRATGDLAEGPADSVAAIETEEASKENLPESPNPQFSAADMESMSANGGASSKCPSSSNAKSKKRGRSAEGISKGLAEMADAFGIMFENTNNRMAEIAHRIGYAHDLSQQRRQVNAELSLLPLDSNQRLRAASMIVQDAERIDLFFSLSQEEKVEWVFMLLSGYI